MSDRVTEGDVDLTLSAERLVATTRRVPIGTAVLRKVIVVEQRTVTVEVAHEEARLEWVPFDRPGDEVEAGGAHLGLPELVLHREEVVVTKRVVPVERVRARIESVTEDRVLEAEVRREEIAVDREASAD